MDDYDFEEQLRMERESRMGLSTVDSTSKRTRVEDDGSVMEFDEEKRAWFPKVFANVYLS